MTGTPIKFLIFSILLVITISACTAVTATISSPTQLILPPTLTVIPPTDTIAITPTVLPPTATNLPAFTPTPTGSPAISVQMKAGQTELDLSGYLTQANTSSYLVYAQSGQFMMVSISSFPSISLDVQAPDGTNLTQSSNPLTHWQGILPLTGNYKLSIKSKESSGSFNLNITIPVQVKFTPGTTSEALQGSVSAHNITTYMLRAAQDQTLNVSIDSPGKDIFLTIYGLQDGQPYLRSEMGRTSASIKLPSTQDYMVQCVSTSDTDEQFKITFQAK